MKSILFRNESKHQVRVPDLGIDVGPGETCMVPEGYAFPRRSHAGGRFPSVIEQLADCPGCEAQTNGRTPEGLPNHKTHCMLVPVDEADVERFAKTPSGEATPYQKTRLPTVNDLVSAGVPRGVAEQIVKAAIASAQAAKDGILKTEDAPAKAKKSEKPAAE